MCSEIVVVRSKTEQDAVVRLQSDALLRGLEQISTVPVRMIPARDTAAQQTLAPGSCVLLHYDDLPAAAAVRSLHQQGLAKRVGCFGSDIYTYAEYLDLHDFVTFYMAPTRLHKALLSQQLYKPVYLLPEAVDPAALTTRTPGSDFPLKESTRVLWFGYPESFEKGMASLVPVIKLRQAQGAIASFALIIGVDGFKNRFNLDVVPYAGRTFAQNAAKFDYCVLSHLSLDLTLNSYVKSPNKLVTSLLLGLIPLASRTPAYEDLLEEFGLGRFLFASPAELYEKLGKLDPKADSAEVRASGIVPSLLERFSDASVAREFLKILDDAERNPQPSALDFAPAHVPYETPKVHIVEHVRDLVPSLKRYWKTR